MLLRLKKKFKIVSGLLNQFVQIVASSGQTYYPDTPRKNKLAIIRENVAWIIKHRELNRYYYIYGLDRKEGNYNKDVIGYRSFTRIRDSRNLRPEGKNFNYAALLRDKFVFGQFLNSLQVPTPKNVALMDSNTVTSLDTMQQTALNNFIHKPDVTDGFCKKLTGLQGKGAFRLKIGGGKIHIADTEINSANLTARLDGMYLFQERVVQHEEMNRLYPHSLNTMRIVTFNNNGNIEVFNAAMRIGTGTRNVDNWGIGGIAIGIDLDTGKLRRKGYYKPTYGRLTEIHPDTQVRFEDFKIPFFKESIELISKVHRYLYGVHSIGWDVAVGPDGPIIIEGNEDWDGSFAMAEEAQFKKRFLRMYAIN